MENLQSYTTTKVDLVRRSFVHYCFGLQCKNAPQQVECIVGIDYQKPE